MSDLINELIADVLESATNTSCVTDEPMAEVNNELLQAELDMLAEEAHLEKLVHMANGLDDVAHFVANSELDTSHPATIHVLASACGFDGLYIPSMESFHTSPQRSQDLTLESLKDKAKALWSSVTDAIAKVLKSIARWFTNLFNSSEKASKQLKKAVDELEQAIAKGLELKPKSATITLTAREHDKIRIGKSHTSQSTRDDLLNTLITITEYDNSMRDTLWDELIEAISEATENGGGYKELHQLIMLAGAVGYSIARNSMTDKEIAYFYGKSDKELNGNISPELPGNYVYYIIEPEVDRDGDITVSTKRLRAMKMGVKQLPNTKATKDDVKVTALESADIIELHKGLSTGFKLLDNLRGSVKNVSNMANDYIKDAREFFDEHSQDEDSKNKLAFRKAADALVPLSLRTNAALTGKLFVYLTTLQKVVARHQENLLAS